MFALKSANAAEKALLNGGKIKNVVRLFIICPFSTRGE